MGFAKYFDTRPWYILHIVGLVAVAFLGGHFLQDWICKTTQFCIERGTNMLIKNLIFYSVLAYLYDTLFHKITKLD
jgi:hypothetical protein